MNKFKEKKWHKDAIKSRIVIKRSRSSSPPLKKKKKSPKVQSKFHHNLLQMREKKGGEIFDFCTGWSSVNYYATFV